MDTELRAYVWEQNPAPLLSHCFVVLAHSKEEALHLLKAREGDAIEETLPEPVAFNLIPGVLVVHYGG